MHSFRLCGWIIAASFLLSSSGVTLLGQTAGSPELDALKADNKKLQDDVARLTAELARKTATPAGALSPDLSGSASSAEAKLATALRSYMLLERENDQLKADAKKLAAEKDALRADLATAKGAIPTSDQVSATQATASQLAAIRDQLRQTQAQLAALATENADLKTRLALSTPPGSAQPAPARLSAAAPSPQAVAPASSLEATKAPENAAPSPAVPRPEASAKTSEPAPAPTSAVANSADGRTHKIAPGDTLSKISLQYYGTVNRWPEILEANRDQISDERNLVVGRTLRIP